MSGIYNPIIFYPVSVLIILFAFLAIKFKNIFYSLLCAIIVFFLSGLIFYILGSEYNAIIQIAIYGIAVPIILGLAIMFTNLQKNKEIKAENKASVFKHFILLSAGVFILAIFYLTITSLAINPQGFNINESIGNTSTQVINSFSQGIFIQYVWSFELIALILTIIVAGLTIFNQRKDV